MDSVIRLKSDLKEQQIATIYFSEQYQKQLTKNKHNRQIIHDLGNIINVVSGRIEKDIKTLSEIEILNDLHIAANIINSNVQKENLEMCTMINQLTNSLKMKDICISTALPSRLYVKANKAALYRILTNLIKNSLHATKNTKNPSIEILLKKKKSFASLTVKDNGIGISKSIIKNIFEFGYGNFNSTGLGLYICKQLVENELGGSIIVSSKVNTFTKVTVKFPITV